MDIFDASGQSLPEAVEAHRGGGPGRCPRRSRLRTAVRPHPWGYSHDSLRAYGVRCRELVVFPPTVTRGQRFLLDVGRMADGLGAGGGLLLSLLWFRPLTPAWEPVLTMMAGWAVVVLPLRAGARRLRESVRHLVVWDSTWGHGETEDDQSALLERCRDELRSLGDEYSGTSWYRSRWTLVYEELSAAGRPWS